MNSVKTLYLVDDDQDDRFFIRQAIRDAGAQVEIIEAEDGLELLGLIRQQENIEAALILLDMNMPKMNGLETISALRSDPRMATTPIVMISTSSSPSLIETAYQAGVDNFVTKPSSFEGFNHLGHQLTTSYLSQS
ncbi:response regulator [Salmonirosea aquatica]|uniref:Response regulator n=1 Tax=Salmonirosea aquatica TaxID=2654236 RepID=A0A7C9FZ05_9BACT|nr:response regulator [Cytophagaceae bacterium SJW1-29]